MAERVTSLRRPAKAKPPVEVDHTTALDTEYDRAVARGLYT